MKYAFATMIGLLVLATPGFAQTEATVDGAGWTASHPLYFMDRMMERVQLAFAFDDETRARMHYEFAQERLAEAQELKRERQERLAEQALGEYENELDETDQETETAVARGKNVTALIELINENFYRHVAVLQSLREETSEDEQARIDRIIEQMTEKHSAMISRLERETPVNFTIQVGNMTRTMMITPHMAEKFIENSEKFMGRMGITAVVKSEKAAEQIADAKEKIAEAEALNSLLPEVLHLIDNAKSHLSAAETAFDSGSYGRAFGQAVAAEALARNAIRFAGEFGEEEDKADLEPNVEFASENVTQGENVTLAISVKNEGSLNAEDYTVEIFDVTTNQTLATLPVDLTPPGGVSSLSFVYENPSVGEHLIRITADSTNVVDESDETNNIEEEDFRVVSSVAG